MRPPGSPAMALSARAPLPPAPDAPPPDSPTVGHELHLAAAFAKLELPGRPEDHLTSTGAATLPPAGQKVLLGTTVSRVQGIRRWSGDGWLYFRRDRVGPLATGEPFYGRSQAGAVLRYSLAPSSRHRPVGYLRVTQALAGPAEDELAAGLAARPFGGLPVSVAAELRVTAEKEGREMRPAVFAVTELPPIGLPFGWLGEAYAQAGYVGGRFATAFVDGQARVDARLANLGRGAQLRVGGGIWGGAQKHAARLDIGPGATVAFRLGEAQARLALDYRVRVAGDAEPRSGPALTFSAGF